MFLVCYLLSCSFRCGESHGPSADLTGQFSHLAAAGWTHYVPSRVGDMKPNIFLLHGLAASTQRAWETQSISPHRYLDWGKREAFPSQSPTDTPWCCQPGVWAASATPHPKMPWAHAPDPNPPHTCLHWGQSAAAAVTW